MLVEEVYLRSLGASIQVLIFDETFEQWRVWRAFQRVLGSKDDITLKLYATLLEENGKLRSLDLVKLSNKPRYTVNRSMENLTTLGLAGCDYTRRGSIELRSWYPDKRVLGMMRLIPADYFNGDYPKPMMKTGK